MKYWLSKPAPNHFLSTTMTCNVKATEYSIPRLPVIDEMVKIVLAQNDLPDLSKTVFIGVQHMLETTVTFFDALITLGVKAENMYFAGKCYSSSRQVEEQVQ